MPDTETIKPYAGGNPGGAPPAAPIVHNVEGGRRVVISPEAQVAARAAEDLSIAQNTFTDMLTKRGANRLDDETQARLNEVRMDMMTNPPRPATVVNLHPWPLTFGSGDLYLRGITIPPCPPGQAFAHTHIRAGRVEGEFEENGTRKFKVIKPIKLAGEFVREFSNVDNDGGGVLIYEGETRPDKVDMVETYDPTGRVITTSKPSMIYDEENQAHQVSVATPVMRNFKELLKEAIALRNRVYLKKIQKADHDYRLPDGRGKWLIHDKHLLMAEVLFAEGLITKVPEWNLSDRIEQGLSEFNCKSCGEPIKEGVYKCFKCNNVINIVEAFRDGFDIPEGKYAIATSDELEQIEEIKAEREQNKGKGKAKK